jgi:protein-L-isoaspartate O-methyltransferase
MTITTITTTATPASNVEVVCGDGADGYPNAAPYGRIILTASA